MAFPIGRVNATKYVLVVHIPLTNIPYYVEKVIEFLGTYNVIRSIDTYFYVMTQEECNNILAGIEKEKLERRKRGGKREKGTSLNKFHSSYYYI
jgi:hypothetical protein